MSLRLYLDDCIFSRRFLDVLSQHGHDVVTPADAGLLGANDDVHFAYARRHELIIMTYNPKDFMPLHLAYPDHPGVFAVYQDNDPRDMSHEEIAQAIQNILDAGILVKGQFHVLNMWRF